MTPPCASSTHLWGAYGRSLSAIGLCFQAGFRTPSDQVRSTRLAQSLRPRALVMRGPFIRLSSSSPSSCRHRMCCARPNPSALEDFLGRWPWHQTACRSLCAFACSGWTDLSTISRAYCCGLKLKKTPESLVLACLLELHNKQRLRAPCSACLLDVTL